MTFQEFLKLTKQKWWVILIITTLSSITSYTISSYYLTPIYTNSSTLLVNDRNPNDNYTLTFNDMLLYEKLLGTYKDIILSKRILAPVADDLSHTLQKDISVDYIREHLQVSVGTNSQMITLSADHPDFNFATRLVNAAAESFQLRLKDIMAVNNVQILDAADWQTDPDPISPNIRLNTLVAFILGISSSLSLILLIYFLDTRVRDENELNELELTVLGVIPTYQKLKKKKPYIAM